MADEHFRNVGLPNLRAGQVDPGVALVALYHRAAGKRLHAEAGDEVPGVVICRDTHAGEEERKRFLRPLPSGIPPPSPGGDRAEQRSRSEA